MQNATVLYAAIAILGGLAVPVLASINAAFGQATGSVYFSALILCIVAAGSIATIAFATGAIAPETGWTVRVSWWHLLGGCFFAVYIVSITFVAPKIGVGNAIILVVVAQIVMAVTIDHFGLFSASVVPFSWQRALGLVLLAGGILLARGTPTPPGS